MPNQSPRRRPSRVTASELPDLSLLDVPLGHPPLEECALVQAAADLESALSTFSIAGRVVRIHPGPVVTTFEFQPEPGFRYQTILGLADDLSLALQNPSVRCARLLSRSVIGIEISNANVERIRLRGIFESLGPREPSAAPSLVLGTAASGGPFTVRLDRVRNLLVAGGPSSGKSTMLAAMLASVLFRATPVDVRLALIDPTRLELSVFEGIQHLMAPVAREPLAALDLLWRAVSWADDRHREYQGSPSAPLPTILVVIDELADLMTRAPARAEEAICALAQQGPSVGIHLVVATGHVSENVLTALIKACLASRLSFWQESKRDSRVVLDCSGAEQLLRRGDMLCLPHGTAWPVRLHGACVSEIEVARVAAFWRGQAGVDDR